MLDCCHSGAFPQGAAKGTRTVDVGGRFDGQGRVTLSASTELEYAYEGDQLVGTGAAGSLFTRMAVEGLRTGEADVDNDGQVTIDELYDYVYDRVRDETRYQTPELTGKVRGDLLIATSPRVVVPKLPGDLRRELEDPIKSRRLGAVYELVRLLKGDDAGMRRAAEQQLRSMSTEDDSDSVKSAAASALLDYGSSEESPPKVSQAGSDGSPPNGPSADGSSDEGTGAALEPEPTPVSPPAPRAPTASPGTTRSSIVWAFLAALGTAFGLLPLAYFTFRTAQRLDREGRKGWGAVLWLLGAIAVLWGIVMIVAYANSGNTQ